MNLNEYQQLALETAIYPDKNKGSWLSIVYTALGLGEAGELQGKVKKILRDDDFEVTQRARGLMVDELGDVLWYAACLAHELGYSLEEVAKINVDKLHSRKERGVLGGSGDYR
jgi:NTP pyrophosphatase (non-canonical NTP hydrolase)